MTEPAELDRLAFPFQARFGDDVMEPSFGMTLRDWFAGQALAGGLAKAQMHRPAKTEDLLTALAEVAYEVADAMLVARQEQGK